MNLKITTSGQYTIIASRDENDLSLGYMMISIRKDGRGAIAVIEISDKNKGIGRQLVKKAEEIFKNNNVKNIYTSEVTKGAEGFWDKMGYRQKFGSRQWNKTINT